MLLFSEDMAAMTIVFVTPAGDTEAGILAQWGRIVAEAFQSRTPTCEVMLLDGHVSRSNMQQLAYHSARAVLFFCHGRPDSLGNSDPLLDLNNVNLCHGMIVLAIACHSATLLGPACIEGG